MLPLYLLTAAKGQPTLVELKSGETINGVLTEIDNLMNLTLTEVIETSANGESFLKIPEIFVRGKDIKYLRLPEELIGEIKQRNVQNQEQRYQRNRNNNSNNDNRNNNKNYNNQRRSYNANGGRYNQNRNNNNNNNRGGRYNNDQRQQHGQQQQHQQQSQQQQ